MEYQIIKPPIVTMTGDGVSDPLEVMGQDFQHVSFSAVGSDTSNLSIRILGSYQDTPPDFTVPSTADNMWSYVQLKNVNDSAYEDGDAGYVFSGDETVSFELNTTGMNWYAVEVFDYTSGQVDIQFMFKNNI